MLDLADEKDVYRSLEQCELGQNNHIETFPIAFKGKFDFVTAAGLINNNHLDEKIFEQMLVALKPGGIMVFSARYSFLGNFWYTEKLEEMEKLGRIKALKCEKYFKYDKLLPGVGKFQKTPVKVFAYKKTEEDSILAFARLVSMKKASGTSVSTVDSEK